MNEFTKILVVDDEELNLDIMEEYLGEKYKNLELVTNGQACIESVQKHLPDIILLDVSMPGLNGYETCTEVKKIDPNISVIFVSARGSAEERLMGYEAGGDDYVIKPFQEQEILKKIEGVISFRSDISALEDRLNVAEDTAFDAIVSSAELGQVITLFDELLSIDSRESIALKLLDYFKQSQLKVVLMISEQEQQYYYSHSGKVAPLEKDLLMLLAGKGRIFEHNRRCQFNYPSLSVLVKNMPVDDDIRLGRLRDNVLFALNGANNSIEALTYKQSAKEKEQLDKLLKVINETISNGLGNLQQQHEKCESSAAMLREMVEKKLPFMGLDEDQEELINSVSYDVVDAMEEVLGSLDFIAEQLHSINKK